MFVELEINILMIKEVKELQLKLLKKNSLIEQVLNGVIEIFSKRNLVNIVWLMLMMVTMKMVRHL